MIAKQNLAHLKPGDVIYTENFRNGWGDQRKVPFCRYVVDRLTAKQVVTTSVKKGAEFRFRIEDGMMIGGRYGTNAFVPTEEQVQSQIVAVKVLRAQLAVKVLRAQLAVKDKIRYIAVENDEFWLMLNDAITAFEAKKAQEVDASKL